VFENKTMQKKPPTAEGRFKKRKTKAKVLWKFFLCVEKFKSPFLFDRSHHTMTSKTIPVRWIE